MTGSIFSCPSCGSPGAGQTPSGPGEPLLPMYIPEARDGEPLLPFNLSGNVVGPCWAGDDSPWLESYERAPAREGAAP